MNHLARYKSTTTTITAYLLVSYFTLRVLNEQSKKNVEQHFGNHSLLVIAHPDDESMFFGPTILNLIKNNRSITILCLSNGDADNLGQNREQEFDRVVKAYGPLVSLQLIKDSLLPDAIDVEWNIPIVVDHIKNFLKVGQELPGALITFDSDGVSGHSNHKSIHQAVAKLKEELNDLNILTLKSVSLVRKYTFFMDSVITLLYKQFQTEDTSITLSIDLMEHAKLKDILGLHHSQMVWFRRLYMMFSRYMFINNFEALA